MSKNELSTAKQHDAHLPDPSVRAEEDAAGVVTHEEARDILSMFIASHFRKVDREHARFTIPVDPRRDSDVRLSAYINRMEALEGECRRLRAERDALANATVMLTSDGVIVLEKLQPEDPNAPEPEMQI